MKKYLAFVCLLIMLLPWEGAKAATEPILPGDLIKGESSSAVYFYFGNRYAFPNEVVYFSWYSDFSSVKTVTDEFLASVSLADNVRFKPGEYMLKIQSDPKVYFLEDPVTLRWIRTEEDAERMYGSDWAMDVRDVPVALFSGYVIGEPLENPSFSNVLSARFIAATLGEAFFKAVDNTPPLFSTQPHPSEVVEPKTQSKLSYSADMPGTEAELVAFFNTALASDGWSQAYDHTYVSTEFNESVRFLTYTKETDARSVHSVTISLPNGGTGEFSSGRIELINDSVFYPRSAIVEAMQDADFSIVSSMTFDSMTEIRPYYVNTAVLYGWSFVFERTEQDVLPIQSIYFKKPGTHDWLIVDLVDFATLFGTEEAESGLLSGLQDVVLIQMKNINAR
jgi:hypothetical protein